MPLNLLTAAVATIAPALERVASFDKKAFSASQKAPPTNLDQVPFEGLKNWNWPERDCDAVRDSLFGQAARRIPAEVPTWEQRMRLIEKALKTYPGTRPPKWAAGQEIDSALLREHIAWVVDHDLNSTGNPGFPLNSISTEIGKLALAEREFLIDVVCYRVHILAKANLGEIPVQLVEGGFADMVRLFVKNEPHANKKKLSKRWRLISSMSLVDQIIDKLLYSDQNKVEISLWEHLPSCPGIGFEDADLVKFHDRVLKSAGGDYNNIGAGDVQGFDWSVREWELMDEALVRVALANAFGTVFDTLVTNRTTCVCRSLFATEDGDVYAQTSGHYGVQKSGTVNTSSGNSRIRVMLAWLIGADWAYAMGDDCLEQYTPDAAAKYEQYGHKLKFYEQCQNSFSFCSQMWSKSGAIPEDFTKSLYKLLSNKEVQPNQMDGFLHNMRNIPELALVVRGLLDGWVKLSEGARFLLESWQSEHDKKEQPENR